jgi:hypothetical protein
MLLMRAISFDDQPGILDSHEYPGREQRHNALLVGEFRPLQVDARRGEHFLQADFPVLIDDNFPNSALDIALRTAGQLPEHGQMAKNSCRNDERWEQDERETEDRNHRLFECESLKAEWRRDHRACERIQDTQQADAIPNEQSPPANVSPAECPPNQRSSKSG